MPSTSYTITAVSALPRWATPTQEQLDEYNRTIRAYMDDLAAMLADVFPAPHQVTNQGKDALFHHLPTVKLLGDDPRGLWDVVNTKVTTNGFLRLSLVISYTEKTWKQVKMTLSGDRKSYIIDGEKMKAAADAILSAYHLHYARKAQQDSAADLRDAAEVEAFKALRPELEFRGISFSNVRDDGRGGTVQLTDEEHGPRAEIIGNTCVLKLTTHARESVALYLDLIPAFSDLFKQNAAAMRSR